MTALRFLMFLSLVVWLGGIVFFGAVVAPTLFSTLPSRQLAGAVVTRSLSALHWIGIVSGIVFAATSMAYSRLAFGSTNVFAARHLLIYAMVALTLISQFGIAARMETLRTDMGVIDDVAPTDARRIAFNRLHHWSTRIEMSVLVLGLAALFLTVRRLQ
ncbi:MAG TPA: DUF4149 domain-containing protein [Terriglobales bacterium]|nr:DUF4149 domain-containing protein [Terriglobales bacterium]